MNRREYSPESSKYTLVIAFLLAALVLTACGGSGQTAQPTKGDVTVYVAVPLSGFQANGGQTVLGGARLKAAEINAKGGLMGCRVVVEGVEAHAHGGRVSLGFGPGHVAGELDAFEADPVFAEWIGRVVGLDSGAVVLGPVRDPGLPVVLLHVVGQFRPGDEVRADLLLDIADRARAPR